MSRLASALRPLAWPVLLASVFAAGYAARVHREMVDFEVYRTAAARAMAAAPLYRPDDGHYQYKYLPAFAIALRPFAAVPDPMARVAWYALSCGLLVVFLRWAIRALPERRRRERALAWLAVLFLGKFIAREINLGQSNLLLGALLLAALLALQTGARRTAGVLVGLGMFVKVYAALLLPWLLLAGGVPAVAVAGVVVAAGLAAPALVYGWPGNLDQLAAWFATVTETTAPNLLNPENVSALAMWTKWVGPGHTAAWLGLATACAAAAIALLALRGRHRVSDPLYLEFGLLMLLVPVLSPQGWDYVLILAAPAVLLILDRWPQMHAPWRITAGLALSVMSFTIYDLIGRTAYRALMDLGVMTIAVLTLVVCLVHLRARALA